MGHTKFDIPATVKLAIELAANEVNIKSSYRTTGIWPMESTIFQKIEFESYNGLSKSERNELGSGRTTFPFVSVQLYQPAGNIEKLPVLQIKILNLAKQNGRLCIIS